MDIVNKSYQELAESLMSVPIMNERNFVRLKNNFILYSNFTEISYSKRGNIINILAYFSSYSQALIHSAEKDLGITR